MRATALLWMIVALAALGHEVVSGQTRPTDKPERAKPPQWSQRVTSSFFDDASQAVSGSRPVFGGGGSAPIASVPGVPPAGTEPAAGSGGVFGWSKIISAETIEDEIKAINLALDKDVSIPQQHISGGYRVAQKHLTMLAVLFAIVGEYDADIRWKDQAPGARDVFAQAGFGSRVGTQQSYNQARGAKEMLADLVRGASVSTRDAEAAALWDNVAYRPPLMQRLEEIHMGNLLPWTASEAEFRRNNDRILHEAELLAALAEVIGREGFDYADEEEYREAVEQMKRGALDLIEAVKLNNAAAARSAIGEVTKSCAACHEFFRG